MSEERLPNARRPVVVFIFLLLAAHLIIAFLFLPAKWTTEYLPLPELSSNLFKPESISPEQESKIQEIADLMLQIYTTLAAMRCVPHESIVQGPHTIDLRLARKLRLDPSVIRLHQILPYIDKEKSETQDFIFGGAFADFRDAGDVEQSRDPFYAFYEGAVGVKGGWDKEGGEYMRPGVTALSMMGNHQSVIICDVRKNRIWIIDQEFWSSTDPALKDTDMIYAQSGNKNTNNFDHIPSRDATDVLKDIIKWYRKLDFIPGDSDGGSPWFEYEPLKKLYIKNGWPESFHGDAFEIDNMRRKALAEAKYHAGEPLRRLQQFKDWGNYLGIATASLQSDIASETDIDKQWRIRLKLYQNKESEAGRSSNLKSAEADSARLCPQDVCAPEADWPIWEQEQLRQRMQQVKGQINGDKNYNWIKEKELTTQLRAHYDSELVKHEAELVKLKAAFNASKSDAEQLHRNHTAGQREAIAQRLGSQRASEDIIRKKDFGLLAEKQIRNLSEWAAQVPQEATKTMGMVKQILKSWQDSRENSKKELERKEKWYAEHGNSDGVDDDGEDVD